MKVSSTVLVAGLLALSAIPSLAELANGIVSVVDEAVITYNEVNMQSEDPIKALLKYSVRPVASDVKIMDEKISKIRHESLEELEDRQLILHEFKTAGYSLPEKVLDDLVNERIRERFHDRATLAKTLQAEGLTVEKYRQRVRDQFIIEQLRYKNIQQEIIISPHKVENYYLAHKPEFQIKDEVRLRMIVLNKASSQNEEQTRKLAEEILAKLNEGKTFTELASMYSQGNQRNQNGVRDWEEVDSLRKELAEAASKLKIGEHSGVIEAPEACYLLYVEDKRSAHFKSLGDVRAEIEKSLLLEERSRLEKQWIERLKKKTFVRHTF